MSLQNHLLYRLFISLTVAVVLTVLSTANPTFAGDSVSCKAGPDTWEWGVSLKRGDVLRKEDVFILVLGLPVKENNLITPSNWKVKSIQDNKVQWSYIGQFIKATKDSAITKFGYKDHRAVDGTVAWALSFPTSTKGQTCGPVSLTSPKNASLAAPSADTLSVAALVSPEESGNLQSVDGNVTISFEAGAVADAEEIIFTPQPETQVNNFTVLNSFTLDTYQDDDSQQESADLSQPVTVQVKYTDGELNIANEEDLKLYYFEPASSEWVSVESVVDVAANTVVAELRDADAFDKLYAVMASAPKTSEMPASDTTANTTVAGQSSNSASVAPAPGVDETSDAVMASAPETTEPATAVSEPSTSGLANLTNLLGIAALVVVAGWLGLRLRRTMNDK